MLSRQSVIARYPHYFAVRAIAMRRFPCGGYARLVFTDLAHDRRALEARDPRAPFVWAIHSRGTHIITPSRSDLRDAGSERLIRTIHREHATLSPEFFVWDGYSLRRETLAQAIAFLHANANWRAVLRAVDDCPAAQSELYTHNRV